MVFSGLETARTTATTKAARATTREAAWEARAFSLGTSTLLATCTISCNLVGEGAEEVTWHEVAVGRRDAIVTYTT